MPSRAAVFIPKEWNVFFGESCKRLDSSCKIGYESPDVCQAPLKRTQLLKVLRRRHFEYGLDFTRVDFYSPMSNDKP